VDARKNSSYRDIYIEIQTTRTDLSRDGYPGAVSCYEGFLGEVCGFLGGVSGIFGSDGRSSRNFNRSFPGNKQPKCSEHKESRKYGQPFRIVSYNPVRSIALAWNSATPTKMFVCTFLFGLFGISLCMAVTYFFSDK
jgi:hypothetical protein